MRRWVIPVVLMGALCVPATASGHVTLQPSEVPAGEFQRLNVRVPNERDNASTTRVELRFPPGFLSVSYEPVPGWDIRVVKRRLRNPVEEQGERVTERVGRVVISGGSIAPGAFQDFGLSLRMPDEPGETLVFPAIQTYDSGEVVRWIGPEDADEPAPRVILTESAEAEEAPAEDEIETEAAAAEDDDEDDGDGLALIALIVGGLGLLFGIWALVSARRRSA